MFYLILGQLMFVLPQFGPLNVCFYLCLGHLMFVFTSVWASLDLSTLWESAHTLSLGTAKDGTSRPDRLPTDNNRLRPPPPWLEPSWPWPVQQKRRKIFNRETATICQIVSFKTTTLFSCETITFFNCETSQPLKCKTT